MVGSAHHLGVLQHLCALGASLCVPHSACLETYTKESDMCESRRDRKLVRRMGDDWWDPLVGGTTYRPSSSMKGSSESIHVGTRKMSESGLEAMRVRIAHLPTSKRHIPLVSPIGWTSPTGCLEALFPIGRRVESFVDELNMRQGILVHPTRIKNPHLVWAMRRVGAKSMLRRHTVETKSLIMWSATSPLAMPHDALCVVHGFQWLGCFVHGVVPLCGLPYDTLTEVMDGKTFIKQGSQPYGRGTGGAPFGGCGVHHSVIVGVLGRAPVKRYGEVVNYAIVFHVELKVL
ncbi:hypothetical protein TanjilG_08064 [Lupinus angustifolius]|uniref:Uncharacterized protein n=1 Tax=Lupinus angustifolius TaxID=3871 RepID=A0A4P1RLX4_LUPAN|nr:hypothetical protein TanjilG_08064 [Lupinus angustifolius]